MSTILLVEDEILILDTTSELLELMGHQVFVAKTGGRALEVLAERNGHVDLVMLDLSLPDIHGYQLLPELAEKYPDLEAAVSLTAAIADAMNRGEALIDIFAAGPQL